MVGTMLIVFAALLISLLGSAMIDPDGRRL
jgi:hypothetical protein